MVLVVSQGKRWYFYQLHFGSNAGVAIRKSVIRAGTGNRSTATQHSGIHYSR